MLKRGIALVAILLFLLSANSVYAEQETLGSFERNTEVRIAQVCSDASFINISSIVYPNSSTAAENIEMIAAGSGEFYYDFNLTSNNGRYDVRGISDGCTETFATFFTIDVPSIEETIFYIALIALLVAGFGLIVYFGIAADGVVVKSFALGFGYLFLIGISFVSWNMATDFITSSSFLAEFLRITFLTLMIGFFPFLIILFVYGVYMMITIKEIKGMVERGIPESEAAERAGWRK